MAQSLAKLLVHLIYSTKNRTPCLSVDVRPQLWAYKVGILKNLGCPVLEIGGVEDHIHILFSLARTITLAKVVEEVKTGATKWLKTQSSSFEGFHWQNGYGAFSVSPSQAEPVRGYIKNQEEHHRKTTFQGEFRAFLKKHGIEFDERYVWD